MRPPFSFPRKKTGVARPKERRSPLQASSLKSCNACRIGYLPSSVSKRLDYLLSSLSLCLQFATLTQSPRNLRLLWICADLLLPAKAALLGLAAICALSIAGDYTAPKQDSRAAADNRSRPNRIAALMRLRRVQVFSFRRCQGHSSPRLPIKFLSLGGQRGIFSFLGKRISPLTTPLRGAGKFLKAL